MRRLLPFLIPFGVIVAAGLVVTAWFKWDAFVGVTRPEPVEVPLKELSLMGPQVVTTEGMAHFPVKITQRVPGNLLMEEQTWYVFPLFERYDTDSRDIRVLVRTKRPPEDLVGFEFMRLSGRLSRPTPDAVPYDTEIILGQRTDYFFTDDMMVFEAWEITSDGETWTDGK